MRLDWQPGDAITSTRLTTIPDTLKVASLPSDYEAVARGVRNDDDFIRELVNLGWPLRFAHAIATSIMQFLETAYATSRMGAQGTSPHRDRTQMFSGHISMDFKPKSILVDSGAQISYIRESGVGMMEEDSRPSTISITSANTKTTNCKWQGMVTVNGQSK